MYLHTCQKLRENIIMLARPLLRLMPHAISHPLCQYLLNCMAHMVQYPWRRVNVCIGMISEEGAGKSIVWSHFMGAILGNNYLSPVRAERCTRECACGTEMSAPAAPRLHLAMTSTLAYSSSSWLPPPAERCPASSATAATARAIRGAHTHQAVRIVLQLYCKRTRDWFAITGKPRSYGYSLLRVASPTGTHSYGNTVPVVYSTARSSILYVVDLLPVQCNLTIAWRCCYWEAGHT
jgi:hypothetical protein